MRMIIVLAEIAPGLDLDQLQQNLAGIFQPMDGADRDIDRFVLVHDLVLAASIPSDGLNLRVLPFD
jgi:hypothetical protein